MRKIWTGVMALIVIVSVCAASPWVSASFAEQEVIKEFERRNNNVQDGCGFNCKGCGVRDTQKALFGRKVLAVYACGLVPSDSPKYHQNGTLFVSFLGTVH